VTASRMRGWWLRLPLLVLLGGSVWLSRGAAQPEPLSGGAVSVGIALGAILLPGVALLRLHLGRRISWVEVCPLAFGMGFACLMVVEGVAIGAGARFESLIGAVPILATVSVVASTTVAVNTAASRWCVWKIDLRTCLLLVMGPSFGKTSLASATAGHEGRFLSRTG